MEDKKQYSALTIDRAAFLLLRVKKAFKKKKLQRKERERNAQLAAARVDQRASCAGLESAGRTSRKPPPLLRSRTLPAIVVPGVSILQAQLGNYNQDVRTTECEPVSSSGSKPSLASRFNTSRVSFSRDDTAALDIRRKSAVSRLCATGNFGPERGTDGTLLLRVPAPHVIAAKHYKISSPNTGNNAFNRLSKLLYQSSKNNVPADDTNVIRRLSWERRDTINSRMPRSASIDSMVEAVWAESVVESTPVVEKRASLRTDRTLALVSPSVGRRMKGQRGVNGESFFVYLLLTAVSCSILD